MNPVALTLRVRLMAAVIRPVPVALCAGGSLAASPLPERPVFLDSPPVLGVAKPAHPLFTGQTRATAAPLLPARGYFPL